MNTNLESLNLSPEQLEVLKTGGSLEMWDDHGRAVPMVIEKDSLAARSRKGKNKWTIYDYQRQLELANETRNALLATLAELYRLYFEAWDKKASIEFGSSALRSLGFSHHDKIRSLRALEKAGWIVVQWRNRKSPQIKIIRGLVL
jgi:hypothetical protein